MKDMKMKMGKRGVRFLDECREWRLPGLLYVDKLVFVVNQRRHKGNGMTFY